MTGTMRAIDGDSPAKAWARALALTARIGHAPDTTLPTLLAEQAQSFGDKPALIGEKETLNYHFLIERANRYSRWALAQGLGRGDVVCLLMHNCPEYLAAWIGITRIGGIASLINTNLVGDSLRHAIGVVAPRAIIVGADLAPALSAVVATMQPRIPCWVSGEQWPGMRWLDDALQHHAPDALSARECALPTTRDRALYIYTSGTTGLPKAAVITHHRVLQWSYWFAGILDSNESDRMYDCLPMYHSVGGVVAIGSVLVRGGSVVVRRKFSASAFWADVCDTECTLFQYIGELCRVLLNAPPDAREQDHYIRIACGNGLRADVWEAFQARFAIPRIVEFYAATEANFSLCNCEGKPGAIGRVPRFLAHRFPIALIVVDGATGEPLRDERGLCRLAGVGEVGEAVGRITTEDSAPEGHFTGYTDATASRRKVVHNVLAEGDAWYRSGDLMRCDAAGYFYFVDRVGDTYRWKGENVSTKEVEDAVCAWPEVREAVAYGVEVPGHDGRAGMVAIVPNGTLDLEGFRRHLTSHLAEFARPVFVRIVNAIETTTTFKPRKQELVRAGFDHWLTRDRVFVHDRHARAFVPVDQPMLERIRSAQMRI